MSPPKEWPDFPSAWHKRKPSDVNMINPQLSWWSLECTALSSSWTFCGPGFMCLEACRRSVYLQFLPSLIFSNKILHKNRRLMKLCKLRWFLPQALGFPPRTTIVEELFCKQDLHLCQCPGAMTNASATGHLSCCKVRNLLCPHLIKGADFIVMLYHLAALQGLWTCWEEKHGRWALFHSSSSHETAKWQKQQSGVGDNHCLTLDLMC